MYAISTSSIVIVHAVHTSWRLRPLEIGAFKSCEYVTFYFYFIMFHLVSLTKSPISQRLSAKTSFNFLPFVSVFKTIAFLRSPGSKAKTTNTSSKLVIHLL